MKKSILVLGVGRFGRGVIEGLYERGHDIFAIDRQEEHLDEVRDMIISGAIIDVAEDDEELIRIIGEKNFDEAVVAMGEDFEGTLIATHILKEAGIPVSVKAASERKGSVLTKMGADRVVFPERDMGRRLAQFLSSDGVIDLLELPHGFIIEQMQVGKRFAGRTIADLNTTNRFGVWLLLIYKNDDAIQPLANTVINRGDTMIVFGKRSNVLVFEEANGG